MWQQGRKFFAPGPPEPNCQKVKFSTFSELGHVAYQIKLNHEI